MGRETPDDHADPGSVCVFHRRDDLFHRLNEFRIDLPLLRERRDDIPTLARFFLREANRELGKNVKGISAEALRLFLDYHWPGNARELRNVIRKSVLLTVD